MKTELEAFAESELARLGDSEDQSAINKNVMEIVKVFCEEGHSGFSANCTANLLDRILRWQPLTAIEDKPEDWKEVGEGSWQHKRYSAVFKDKDSYNGQAYNVRGLVFSDDDGKTWYTNKDSAIPVEFPYVVPGCPRKRLVKKDADGNIIKVTEYIEG